MSRINGNKLASAGFSLPYPEIFFKLQPDIAAACDELESKGIVKPTQETLNTIVERIHTDVCKRYPDLARQAEEFELHNSVISSDMLEVDGVLIQQRGFFRGLIAFLLLRELLRRRRRRRRRF